MATMTASKSKTASRHGGCGCGGKAGGSSGGGGCGCGGGCGGGCSCGTSATACDTCVDAGYVRPTFFAGQLLTEDDLQALTRYVADKNRLHNRHFVGEGVVCGMEVLCEACGGGSVVVRPGYAVDCCGNDIVLSCPQTLDLLAMVREMRRSKGYDCGDPCEGKTESGKQFHTASGNADYLKSRLSRYYCLYVRYCEQPSDPVSPYAVDEPCGGSTCEPTRVREGFRFELRCREDPEPDETFFSRMRDATGSITELEAAVAGITADPIPHSALSGLKELLLDRLDACTHTSRCSLYTRIKAVQLPDTSVDAANTQPESKAARLELITLYLEHLVDAACLAVIPPCRPCDDTAVLLACVELRECDVVSICNLERRFALTWPAMRHWLPLHSVGDFLEAACCDLSWLYDALQPEPEPQPPPPPPPVPPTGAIFSAAAASTAAPPSTATTATTTTTAKPTLTTGVAPKASRAGAWVRRVADSVLGPSRLNDPEIQRISNMVEKYVPRLTSRLGERFKPDRIGEFLSHNEGVRSVLAGAISEDVRKQGAELERRSADLERRSADLERANADLLRRNAELEKRHADIAARIGRLEQGTKPDAGNKPRRGGDQ